MIFTLEYCAVNAIENAPFKIDRPDGSFRYIFFHFTSQVVIKINGKDTVCSPGTCILYEPNVYQHFFVENNRLNHDYIDFISNEENFFKEINFPVNIPFNPKDSKYINSILTQIVDEKTKKVYNILGDYPETIANYIVPRLIKNKKNTNAHL